MWIVIHVRIFKPRRFGYHSESTVAYSYEMLHPAKKVRVFDLVASSKTTLTDNLSEDTKKPGSYLSSLLSTGLFAAEYGLGIGGRLTYAAKDPENALWDLLNKFTVPTYCTYSRGSSVWFASAALAVGCTIQQAHQELKREHRLQQERGED
ncbi:hypothetical protein AC579_10111 [Pseudocercospora musae]|uniref:Uncharacterized protein n=1 Tax=Pseudocercospora musae TaxID=113226 RepID=A0A139GT74_9PEZI|nr:hypothetical protein AC579_10111 [Pseudocercospora musae]